MSGINYPIPQEWEEHITAESDKLEIIPDFLYDTQTYTDNTTTQLTFFNDIRANLSLSNMRSAGQLPNPEAFLIQYLRVFTETISEPMTQGRQAHLPLRWVTLFCSPTRDGLC